MMWGYPYGLRNSQLELDFWNANYKLELHHPVTSWFINHLLYDPVNVECPVELSALLRRLRRDQMCRLLKEIAFDKLTCKLKSLFFIGKPVVKEAVGTG